MGKRKIIVLGDDGMIPEVVWKLKRYLPNINRLIKKGIFASTLPSPPVDTPTNWTTIATGAWTKTHQIRGFTIRIPGENLDHVIGTFNNKSLCKAEYLWEACERQGKISILLSYPTAWPPRNVKKSLIIGGDGPFISKQWCIVPAEYYYVSKEKLKNAERIKLVKAKGWKNLPESKRVPLEGIIFLEKGTKATWTKDGWKILGKEEGGEKFYYILLIDTKGKGYEKVVVSKEKDYRKKIALLKEGEWTDWIEEEFSGKGKGSFKFKLVKLSKDGKEIGIFRTPVDMISGWSYPAKLRDEIVENAGPFHQGFELSALIGFVSGWADFSLVEETIKMQSRWFSDVSAYLTSNYEWDILFLQLHIQDALNHRVLGYLSENSPFYDKKIAEKYWKYILATHKLTDNLVGEIFKKCVDEDTVFILLSDHGAIPVYREVLLQAALIKNGYLDFKEENGEVKVNWKKTKAWIDGYNCWVNLKGREPDGIVEKKDYEKMRDEIIRFLYSLTDPTTGECPISVALRREDARMFGLDGDVVGDVVFFMKEGYWNTSVEEVGSWKAIAKFKSGKRSIYRPKKGGIPVRVGSHEFIPGAELDGFSNRGTLIISGPGIPEGKVIPQVNLVDIAPTISRILGIKPPENSEGVDILSHYLKF